MSGDEGLLRGGQGEDDGFDEHMNMEASDDQLESHSESKSLKINFK